MFEYFKNPNCEWITSASTWKRWQVDAYWWVSIIWGNEIIAVRSMQTAVTVLLVVLFPVYVRWAVRAPTPAAPLKKIYSSCGWFDTNRRVGQFPPHVPRAAAGLLFYLRAIRLCRLALAPKWGQRERRELTNPVASGRRIELGLTKPGSCV